MWERWMVVLGMLAGAFLAGACGADDGDVVGAGAAPAAGGRAGAPAGGAGGSGATDAGRDTGGGAGEPGSGGTTSESGAGGEAGSAPVPPELSFARVQAPGSSAIRALWGSGADDVFAAGDEGQLFHFYERSWRLENTGTDSALSGIWGGPGDIYVSVDDNFVLRSPGSGIWTREPLPAGYKLLDIWGSGDNDLYALTGDGVFRGDGSGAWEFEPIEPASAPLTAVWGSSASDVFAVATFAENPTVFHSDGGGKWEEQAGPPATLSDVAGSAPDHVFAAGGNKVYASRGDGNWTAELVLENDVVGAVFALSRSAVYACSENGLLFRSNGAGEWSEGQPVNPNGISPPCQALWASGTDEVYAGTTRGLFRGAGE